MKEEATTWLMEDVVIDSKLLLVIIYYELSFNFSVVNTEMYSYPVL